MLLKTVEIKNSVFQIKLSSEYKAKIGQLMEKVSHTPTHAHDKRKHSQSTFCNYLFTIHVRHTTTAVVG